MRTVDTLRVKAPIERVFRAAADVERWPEILPHYRWVTVRERRPGSVIVEMAAWRPFGPVRYPTWWVSEMWVDATRREVRYRHLEGITRGMDVAWRLIAVPGQTEVTILHEWAGPEWWCLRRPAAEWVIGPVFIHGIASRTLAGIARAVEADGPGDGPS